MCTVTFLPLNNNNFILTSSRDEKPGRKTIFPKIYKEEDVDLLFPKDKIAGGTWIGISSKKRLVCLLNGGFKKHIRKPSYTMSRGVIVKEILKINDFKTYINHVNLEKVEPFTMVIIDWHEEKLNLFELVWNSNKKYFKELEQQPKIWSSATLYNEKSKNIRKKWFKNWQNEQDFSLENILKFHHSEIEDKTQSILMKRTNIETVSITSVKKENESIEMIYEDVISSIKKKYFLITKVRNH
jgi:uncharacterized protein with NRDE domain